MKNIDKHYLLLQFENNVYQKNGAAFQSFFEEIMQKAYPDFQKIKPYGNEGDAGNDGYRPVEGIYYQVYSPQDPHEKEAEAAKKFKNNFNRLKENWDDIAKIKEFNFVLNDKYMGTTIVLARAASELKKDNQNIEFKIFTPHSLEQIFFALSYDQILSLGFDVDSRNTIRIAREYLSRLEVELDKDNSEFVLKALENIKEIIFEQRDENLALEFEIVESRTLQKAEMVVEAREKFKEIFKRYPNDPRAPLYLAEIYLNNEDFGKNDEFLKIAAKIDKDYWLLHIEELIRKQRLGNKIDIANIDERTFPIEPRIRSIYYRVYSLILEQSEDSIRADSFIERAISYNPDRFANYDAKLSILEGRIFSKIENNEDFLESAKKLLFEIEAIEKKFTENGYLRPRNNALINLKKQPLLVAIENIFEFERVVKETFQMALKCYFDATIDKIIASTIYHIKLPQPDFNNLLEYIQKSEKSASDILSRFIVLQFVHNNSLFTDGRKYFEKINRQDILKFINDFEKSNDDAIDFIKMDAVFAVGLAQSTNVNHKFRRKIVEELPNDNSIQKEKLVLLLDYDEGDLDSAFEILKRLDLSTLSYIECRSVYKIAKEKKAWDYIIILSEKLLQHEKEKSIISQIKIQQFIANHNLEKFPEVINIGEEILSNLEEIPFLGDSDREMILAYTVQAIMKRGDYPQAKNLVDKYRYLLKSFEAKISVETEVYIVNKKPEEALVSVTEAIKVLKLPSPEEYGSLFFIFIRIGNLMDFKLSSMNRVEPGCFVKFKGLDRWFFLGDGNELDATKITMQEKNYVSLTGKKIGERVIFESAYRSQNAEYEIEEILLLDKYVLWQSRHHAYELSLEQRWNKMELIEVPKTELSIDTKFILARLEDELKQREGFYKLYCTQAIPLALLSVSEGGLTNAIGKIAHEGKGFIKASTGEQKEFNEQKETANRIIAGQEFYLDGTSAFVLSETGLIEKIFELVPNIKIPQSVISLLLDLRDKFMYIPGQAGYLGLSQGKLFFSSIDKNVLEISRSNFEKSIRILESKPDNISVISRAVKSSCFSEQRVPPSLSDACILSQQKSIPVLTDDFLYLKMNELETKKKAPEYCSSFALLRVLYEQKRISFENYLDFFYYLSTYRYRFLQIKVADIEKAILGDKVIAVVQPTQIRKLNFKLTLSEEYGVSLANAFQLLVQLLAKIITDSSILPEVVEKIVVEIISTFPSNKDRKLIGKALIASTIQFINRKYARIYLSSGIQEKINALSKFIQAWSPNIQIL